MDPLAEGLVIVRARAEQYYRSPRMNNTVVALSPPIKRTPFEGVIGIFCLPICFLDFNM